MSNSISKLIEIKCLVTMVKVHFYFLTDSVLKFFLKDGAQYVLFGSLEAKFQ